MKVLYIVQHFNVPYGAAGIRPYKMAKFLLQNGHEVTVLCGSFDGAHTGLTGPFFRGKREGQVEGINVIEFNIKYSNKMSFLARTFAFFKYVWKTVLFAMRHRYEVVFASSTPLTVGIPGIIAKWFRRKKFVFEVRDLWPELPKAMGVIKNPFVLFGMGVLEYLSYHSADKLIGLSGGITQGIAKRGISTNRIATIPNGCDLDIFKGVHRTMAIEGTSPGDFLCLYAGTHGIANGLGSLINVASALHERGNFTIKFILVGDGREKPALRQKAEAKNLQNIIFLNPVNKTDLAALMRTCHIGMQLLANVPAFYYGTSPNKFFDYIAAGLPVINNYPGWVADLITANNCGFVVPPDNPEAFTDILIRVEQNKGSLLVIGENARALAEREFNREVLAKKWVDWVTN